MRQLLVLCFVLACAGCATPAKVAKLDPVDLVLVQKSVADFISCVVPKLIDVWPLTHVEKIPDGQRIFAEGHAWGPVPAVVDVYESPRGTMVEVRWGPGKSNGITKKLISCG